MELKNLNDKELEEICFMIMNVSNLMGYSDGEMKDSELWVLSSYLGLMNNMPLEPLNSIFKIWNEKGVQFTKKLSDESMKTILEIAETSSPYADEAFDIMFGKGILAVSKLSSQEKLDFVTGIYGLNLHITHSDKKVDEDEIQTSIDIIKYLVKKLNLDPNTVLNVDKYFRSTGGDEMFKYVR